MMIALFSNKANTSAILYIAFPQIHLLYVHMLTLISNSRRNHYFFLRNISRILQISAFFLLLKPQQQESAQLTSTAFKKNVLKMTLFLSKQLQLNSALVE